MLSARVHLLFWALSFISLLAQPLRPLLKEHFSADDEVQGIFKHAISCYGVWLCLYIIEMRTRPPYPLLRQHNRQPMTKGWRRILQAVGEQLLLRRGWFFEVGTALMCLIVGDAALWTSGVAEDGVRGKLVRVLGTYMYLGTVDPIWRYRLRSDMMLFSKAVPELAVRNVLVSAFSIWAVAITVKVAAFAYTRESLDVTKFWFGGATRPHQVLVLILLLAPFADMGDTAVYLCLKKYKYRQYLKRMMRLTRWRSRSVVVERFWVVFWLSSIFCMLMVYDVMSRLWEIVGEAIWGNFLSWVGIR